MAVNAYVAPVVTEDLDIVVATDDLQLVRRLASAHFRTAEFPDSLNIYDPGSRLQVQVQLEQRLTAMLTRATAQEVLGLVLPVAAPEDLVEAKVAAAGDPRRPPSKRMKDILDLARLVGAFPSLAERIPEPLRAQVLAGVDPPDEGSSRPSPDSHQGPRS